MKIKDYDWKGILEKVCAPVPSTKVVEWFIDKYDIEVKDEDEALELEDVDTDELIDELGERGYDVRMTDFVEGDSLYEPSGMAGWVQRQDKEWIKNFLYELAGLGQNYNTMSDCAREFEKLVK